MDFESLDGTKLIIFMIAGAAFAGVGLYLLLRPKVENAAKIELFGLKFESSSAGLLVFVIGAAFMTVPLFSPEKAVSSSPIPKPGAPGLLAESAGDVSTNQPDAKPQALRLPEDPQVSEQEPNDRPQGANIVNYGQTVAGDVKDKEVDWYVFVLPEDAPREIALQVRHVEGGWVKAHLFDGNEVSLRSATVDVGAKYVFAEVGSQTQFFARVTHDYYERVYYELRLFEKQGD